MQDEYRKEQERARRRVHELAETTTAALGAGWTWAVDKNGDGEPMDSATIRGDGGKELHIGWEDYRRKKIAIRGCLPRQTARGEYLDTGKQPTICVSPERPPAAIAGEIRRRLLPAYEAALGKAQATKEEVDAHDRRQAEQLEQFTRLLNGDKRDRQNRGGSARVYFGRYDAPHGLSGHVEVFGDSAHFDVRAEGMAADLVAELLGVLMGAHEGPTGDVEEKVRALTEDGAMDEAEARDLVAKDQARAEDAAAAHRATAGN